MNGVQVVYLGYFGTQFEVKWLLYNRSVVIISSGTKYGKEIV